jgi:diadenosine tetraphosphate (Ap4A) HIT family hydrolase
MPLPPSEAADCPFCAISRTYSAIHPPVPSEHDIAEDPVAHILLNTPLIVAFLDHAPISRGHVLVATRQHRTKLSDVSVEEGQAIGAWLGILSRAVVRVVEDKESRTHADTSDIGDWNVVQNNGLGSPIGFSRRELTFH